MSGLARRLMAGADAVDKLYVDDVFSAYTYTGNGSTQTINNGIDLAGKGGMTWIKCRDNLTSPANVIQDSANGVGSGFLETHLTHGLDATRVGYVVNSYSGSGFVVGGGSEVNYNNWKYASLAFRRAPKFFDVVTYTGNGASNRQIAHALGCIPGMIILKNTSANSNWYVIHKDLGANVCIFNGTLSAINGNVTQPTATVFTVNDGIGGNNNEEKYVAYLFAHDPSADGIIQCGSVNYPGSGQVEVNLGWEPQFILFKDAGTSSWKIIDSMRGMTSDDTGSSKTLSPNSPSAEGSGSWGKITATGFTAYAWNTGVGTYLAIRRPNKQPTTGTQVYNAIARTGTGAAATVTGVGFSPDLLIARRRNSAAAPRWYDRNRGVGNVLISAESSVESLDTSNAPGSFDADGMTLITGSTLNQTSMPYINHFFRRAPGFFDVVCYKGNDSFAPRQHNLGVTPELSISKKRAGAGVANNWWVLTPTKYGYLDAASALTNFSFSMGSASQFNPALDSSNTEYIAYLFATLPGISKVGTYTGNGSSQTISCGFTTGARFVLIKHADSIGDWYIWDTVRGIIAANDPHLSLNSTAAEVTTDDSIDPDVSGFIVNQNTATNINVLGASYIFLAIA